MLVIANRDLHDPRANPPTGVTETETNLVDTELETITSNFDSERSAILIFDETVGNLDLDISQAFFWSEEWQNAESEANKDIRMGNVKTFNSVDELIAELRS